LPRRKSYEELIRELLARRNPHGYYVIPIKIDGINEVVKGIEGAIIEEIGDTALVMVRSRHEAERIARNALNKGLLALEEVEEEEEEEF
jgi:hypothetical protein